MRTEPFGWFLILGLLFSIQDYASTVASSTGQPVTQIFLDTVGQNGAIVLMVIIIGAMFFCGTFSVTSNSRMMYAFSRDGAIPASSFFHKVDQLWLACTLSFLLALPSLRSSVAFSAATSIATIGLYISYGIPIALRVVYADRFVRGPFHLGRLSLVIAGAAVLWIAFIAVVFCLPELNPVNSQTLNYAPVAVAIVVAYSLSFWLVSARKWFAGPVKQIIQDAGLTVADPLPSRPRESQSHLRLHRKKRIPSVETPFGERELPSLIVR
ncbi:amino acid permease-domain-containing protein [Lactarius pseudohatsudake]|nr:amino acid permease-domain-containing protein [Lactarius pseudohatsudake]